MSGVGFDMVFDVGLPDGLEDYKAYADFEKDGSSTLDPGLKLELWCDGTRWPGRKVCRHGGDEFHLLRPGAGGLWLSGSLV